MGAVLFIYIYLSLEFYTLGQRKGPFYTLGQLITLLGNKNMTLSKR